VTAHATFAERLVLEDERTALRGMALEAGFVLAKQAQATPLERLGEVRPSALDRVSFVRVMAIGAAYFSFEHRMVMRQIEFRADLQMTLETGRRRFSWINDLVTVATTLNVETAGTVARFAAHVLGIVALRF
jgi:hypothetical protein